MTTDLASLRTRPTPTVGVRIAGTGCAYPEGRLTNADFTRMVDTSDEWIVQRTGIHERRKCDITKGESATPLCTLALQRALADARMDPKELDLVIVGTVTGEMMCPSTACRVAANVGAAGAAAFDVTAACCGFVYSLNIGHDLIRAGAFRNVAVLGCDVMSETMDYTNRNVCVLFGDAGGAAILRATDDVSRGVIASGMHADGSGWRDLYIPRRERDVANEEDHSIFKPDKLMMRGREVYKFAVGTFPRLIEQTLEKAGITAMDVDMYVCHQSNARMLEAARERLGIPAEKLYMNIDRFGNCSAGSVPVCFDELRKAGKCQEGDLVMFVAFGGGLTWASSLWRM